LEETLTLERTGGAILVDNLIAQGTTLAFCVPGESYLPVLDALYDVRDRLRLIVCRQEGGVAYMAEAHGKLTGRPGIAFVTRGPGASNAAIGIHTAAQDSTPMIVFVGQVGSDFADRESVPGNRLSPDVRQRGQVGAQIDRAERIPEYVARAYRGDVGPARAGRAGPARGHAGARAHLRGCRAVDPSVRARRAQIAAARALAGAVRRPLVLVGGSRWDAVACAALRRSPKSNELPSPAPSAIRTCSTIATQLRGRRRFGVSPRLATRIREADVLLVVGERLGEMTTSGYTLLASPTPSQRLVHVHPDPASSDASTSPRWPSRPRPVHSSLR
jgi:acetolactate synthase-1/2/3 large subunit